LIIDDNLDRSTLTVVLAPDYYDNDQTSVAGGQTDACTVS